MNTVKTTLTKERIDEIVSSFLKAKRVCGQFFSDGTIEIFKNLLEYAGAYGDFCELVPDDLKWKGGVGVEINPKSWFVNCTASPEPTIISNPNLAESHSPGPCNYATMDFVLEKMEIVKKELELRDDRFESLGKMIGLVRESLHIKGDRMDALEADIKGYRSYDLEGKVQGLEEKVDTLEEKLKGIKAWCEIRCAEIKDML